MARPSDTDDKPQCSFCGKPEHQVEKLLKGPGVYICDECVDLCQEILEEEKLVAEEEIDGASV